MELLTIVMKHNIFKFGDSWWVQNVGTAMGTPVACIYATIFFAWFERQNLLAKYKNNILFYVRQIDDIFGIWQHDPLYPNAWNNFNHDLQN